MEHLLTPSTLGQMLSIAEQTIYNRHSNGCDLPPVIKLGRLLRFRPSDVEAWLLRKSQPSEPAKGPACTSVKRRRGRPTKAEQIAHRNAAQQ